MGNAKIPTFLNLVKVSLAVRLCEMAEFSSKNRINLKNKKQRKMKNMLYSSILVDYVSIICALVLPSGMISRKYHFRSTSRSSISRESHE